MEGTGCASSWDLFKLIANSRSNDYYVEESEVCAYWTVLEQYSKNGWLTTLANCTEAMPLIDRDGDGKLNFEESFSVMSNAMQQDSISREKAEQVNCSDCSPHFYH